ncbi:MAG TPA: hypothetical protein VLA75_10710 [Thermoanaerobaculia bacterium]|nr:hypothetical protein [Thermoanaerobaculia bacterium]
MRPRLWIAGALLVGLALGFAGGGVAGNWWTFRWMRAFLENEVVGSQSLRLHQLALLRSGDADRAVELMEAQVDAALASLASGRSWEDLPPPVRRALLQSKRYRELHPPAGGLSPALRGAMDAIPDEPLDLRSCPRPVRRMLGGEAAEPGG